jgi:hypothetical protein
LRVLGLPGLPPYFNSYPQIDPYFLAARERELAAAQTLLRRQAPSQNVDPISTSTQLTQRQQEELFRAAFDQQKQHQLQSDEFRRLQQMHLLSAVNGTNHEDQYR